MKMTKAVVGMVVVTAAVGPPSMGQVAVWPRVVMIQTAAAGSGPLSPENPVGPQNPRNLWVRDIVEGHDFVRTFSLENEFEVGNPPVGVNYGRTRTTGDVTPRSFRAQIFWEGRDYLPGMNDGFGGAGVQFSWADITVSELTPFTITGFPRLSVLPGVPLGTAYGCSWQVSYRDAVTGQALAVVENPREGWFGPEAIARVTFYASAGTWGQGFGGSGYVGTGHSGLTWDVSVNMVPSPGGAVLVLASIGLVAARRRLIVSPGSRYGNPALSRKRPGAVSPDSLEESRSGKTEPFRPGQLRDARARRISVRRHCVSKPWPHLRACVQARPAPTRRRR